MIGVASSGVGEATMIGVSVDAGDVAVITIGVGVTDPGKTHATMKRIKIPKYKTLRRAEN
jgi:hypothetical protein